MADALIGQAKLSQADLDARSLRLGLEGEVTPEISVTAIAEFADGDVSLKDGYIFYHLGRTGVRIGHFKSSNSLEEITSFTATLFLERASFTDVFDFGRYPGVAVRRDDALWGMEFGFFYPTDGGLVLASRGHYGGAFSEGKWLLGSSFRYTRNFTRSHTSHPGEPPEADSPDGLPPVNEPPNSDRGDGFFWGLEAAVQFGRLHMASEWGEWTRRNAVTALDSVMSGGYAEAGWFLTGEARPLLLDKGIWGRPAILRPLSEGGGGAWQIAARLDWIRQSLRADIQGADLPDTQKKVQAALHWYASEDIRMTLQYDHLLSSAPAGAFGAQASQASHEVGFRFQLTW